MFKICNYAIAINSEFNGTKQLTSDYDDFTLPNLRIEQLLKVSNNIPNIHFYLDGSIIVFKASLWR